MLYFNCINQSALKISDARDNSSVFRESELRSSLEREDGNVFIHGTNKSKKQDFISGRYNPRHRCSNWKQVTNIVGKVAKSKSTSNGL